MKKILQSNIVALGLAIFSMLFGAGNLMYPIAVGMSSGTRNIFGMAGFICTAIVLPLIGIVTMILYDGNYEQFFHRLGTTAGNIIIGICMAIIGPVIAMPRIITLSHTMITPFIIDLPNSMIASFVFSIIFLSITFLCTYRESKIVAILGYVVSPLLLCSLSVIIVKGILYATTPITVTGSTCSIFTKNLLRGYETLDLLGALFFSSIILSMLQSQTEAEQQHINKKQLALTGLKGGTLGISLLACVYVGMSILGVYWGHGLEHINSGELFREVALRILGPYGALIVALAVTMACLSTAIALAAVLAEYMQQTLFGNRISFLYALLIVLALCIPLSTAGLGYVLQLTAGPITFIGYPAVIMLTLCNLAYKIWGVRLVKTPVILTVLITAWMYFS